jgi:hypothetical protein
MRIIWSWIMLLFVYAINLSLLFGQADQLIIDDSKVKVLVNNQVSHSLLNLKRHYKESFTYKIINKKELLFIIDEIIVVGYYHFKFNGNNWDFYKFIPLGQSPKGRLESSSAIPKDYNEIKNLDVTFKINGVEDVDIYENGVYSKSFDF